MSEDFGEPIVADEFEVEGEKKDNTKTIIIIVVAVIALLCLCVCCVFFVVPSLLGPSIGTVFSDVIQELGTPMP